MDKIVIIAAVVAVIVVVGAGFFLITNQKSGKSTTGTLSTSDGTDNEPSNSDRGRQRILSNPENITYQNQTFGKMIEPVTGNCTLYEHVAQQHKYACFGTAGNYSVMATNEYMVSNATDYFCKPTVYGCKLYQKVNFQVL